MNKILTFFLVSVFTVSIISCTTDDDSNGVANPIPSGAPAMSAKVNGVDWASVENGITAGLDSTGTLVIIASGIAGTDSSIILLSTEAPQGGPFQIDTTSNNSNSASWNLFFGAYTGEISISAHNANTNNVSGAFNFTTEGFFGSPGVEVTNGVFTNVIYTEE